MIDFVVEKLGLESRDNSVAICPKEFLLDLLRQIKLRGGTVPAFGGWSIGKYLHWKKT